MKRRVRSAIHCAGVDIPYGQVYAMGPEIARIAGVCAEAAELALRERSIDDDAGREAGDDRGRGVADCARAATAATAPEHVGEAQLGQAERGGDAHRIVAVVGVRGDAVDGRHRQTGVVGAR